MLKPVRAPSLLQGQRDFGRIRKRPSTSVLMDIIMQSGHIRPGFLTAGWVLLCATMPAYSAPSQLQFNRDIHPILSENCFACHGPDKNQRKGKLRLDVREVALDRGAIVPGKPDQSKLVERIFSDDPDERMPPPKAH